MQPSANLIGFIKHVEGFSPRAYQDPPHNTRGLYAIGYGHQIQPNEQHLRTAVLTEAEATAFLLKDMSYVVAQTNKAITKPIPQGTFDALVDLGFNAGAGASIKTAEVWNNTGSAIDTAAHLALYNKANGQVNSNLVARRAKEASWILGTEKKNT